MQPNSASIVLGFLDLILVEPLIFRYYPGRKGEVDVFSVEDPEGRILRLERAGGAIFWFVCFSS